MMLGLNIGFFKKNVHVGFVLTKNKANRDSLTVQTNPTKYLVHPTVFRHTPSHARTNPKGEVCSNSEKSNFDMLF